jgi:hypothetical protein
MFDEDAGTLVSLLFHPALKGNDAVLQTMCEKIVRIGALDVAFYHEFVMAALQRVLPHQLVVFIRNNLVSDAEPGFRRGLDASAKKTIIIELHRPAVFLVEALMRANVPEDQSDVLLLLELALRFDWAELAPRGVLELRRARAFGLRTPRRCAAAYFCSDASRSAGTTSRRWRTARSSKSLTKALTASADMPPNKPRKTSSCFSCSDASEPIKP